MARPEVSDYEISVKVAGRQLEFLENRANELGISKEAVIRWYIVSDMARAIDAEREEDHFSLEGRFKDGPPITKEAIDEVIAEWSKIE